MEAASHIIPTTPLGKRKRQGVKAGAQKLLSDEQLFEHDKKYYEQNREKYLKQYEGEYIALRNKEVIAHHKDFSVLAEEVYNKIGYRQVFMPRVLRTEKVHRMSPKFIRVRTA